MVIVELDRYLCLGQEVGLAQIHKLGVTERMENSLSREFYIGLAVDRDQLSQEASLGQAVDLGQIIEVGIIEEKENARFQ